MSGLWYLIRTKPRCEGRAAASLEREGYELFFPRVRSPLPMAGYTTTPLFPGYLFLRYDGDNQGRPSVRGLPGILGWVHFDGVVPAVPDQVVTDLARRVESINTGGGLWTRFRPGDHVLVVSGRVKSLAEVLEEPKSPQARVRVLLDFMGRLVPAQVPWHSLRPVSEETIANENRRRFRRTRGRCRWIRGVGPRAVASV